MPDPDTLDEFDEYLQELQQSAPRSQNTQNLYEEITVYKNEVQRRKETDTLQFWEDKKSAYPILYDIAMIVLAAPTTQVSVERLFSGLSYILNARRTKLKDETLDQILTLRENYNLLYPPMLNQ